MSTTQNINLIGRFSVEEIWHALKNLGKNKALGLNEYTVEFFFLSNTGSFSKTTFNVCLRNFENGKLNASVKENFICLIPKREDAVMVKDYRPISLTSLTYKIMAKVLVERLKRIMQTIIAPSQSALIEGR